MNDSLEWQDWWTKKYRFLIGEGIRYFSFKIALNLFVQAGGMNIVETGTTRADNDFAGGGMSTIILGDFAQYYNLKFWTVDISPEAIELSKRVCHDVCANTTFVLSDSVVFLKTFSKKIDLLYLDSMDCPEYDEPDSPRLIESQNHQLIELQTAWDKLSDKAVVLLDDNNFENGGKCKMSKQFLREQKWTCLINDKQSLWVKI